jgi:hypothetical protein
VSDWLKPPQRDFPLVYGPSTTTLGYYELEETSRANAMETMTQHRRETALWYRALTLHLEVQKGKWTPLAWDGTEEQRHAKTAQIDLLALGLCSSKAALDMILAGYYSVGWAAIRHCMEVALHRQYLAHFPGTYRLWYTRDDLDKDPPRPKQMVEQIRKQHRNDASDRARRYIESLESSYELWRLMSLGSHPTGEGLTQLQDLEEPGSRYWGSNYRYDLTMVSFDNGLGAIDIILNCYYLVREGDPDWAESYGQWRRDLHTWRDELRENKRVAHLSNKLVADAPESDRNTPTSG